MHSGTVPSKLMVCLMFVALALLVALNIDALWGHAVDLAHHYVLVFRIGEQFNLGNPTDPSMGEMNFYPRLSHIVAAVAGFIVGSPLLGLHLTALLSLFLIWFCYVYLLGTLPRALAVASIVCLAVLSFLNKRVFHLEVHGSELVDNYFFSQLMAQSVTMLVIAIGLLSERKAGRWCAYFVLVMGIFINTGIHLLPTLELLGVLGFVLLVDGIKVRRTDPRLRVWLLPALIVPACALAGVLINPAFAAMRQIADNNGGLGFDRISYPVGLITVCLAVMAMSFVAAWAYLRPHGQYAWPVLKYLSALGMAMATLCLLQMVLARFGYGSDYAVKKYGNGLLTQLLVLASVGLGALLLRRPQIRGLQLPGWLFAPGAAVLFFCIATNATPRKSDFDVSELVALEKSMIGLLASQYTPAVSPKQDVVIGLSKEPTFDYMFTLAIARTSRKYATPEIFYTHAITDFSKYDNVITAPGTPRYDSPQCRRNSNRLLVVNSAACLATLAQEVEKQQTAFDFTSDSTLPVGSIDGFSVPEAHGRWMQTPQARFTWLRPSVAPNTLKVKITPFLSAEHPRQRLLIKVNGQRVYEGEFLYEGLVEPIQVAIPAPTERGYVVEFDAPDAISPKALGLSEDTRELSFSVKELTFE
jgi:hypothetical protein